MQVAAKSKWNGQVDPAGAVLTKYCNRVAALRIMTSRSIFVRARSVI